MLHTAPGNLWLFTVINFPAAAAAALSERGHQKRALFEWPHPAYWWGQQQEVDVTIDRRRVISVQLQARTHLPAKCAINVPFTVILLTSIHEQTRAYESTANLCSVLFVCCIKVALLVPHSRCWKGLGEGFEKAHGSAIQTRDRTNH